MSEQAKTRKMRVYRMIDEVRVPFTIELDKDLTVIRETVDEEAYRRVVYGRDSDATTHTMTTWATMEVTANPIPGTDDLREKFQKERSDLHRRIQVGDCRPCEEGKLIRRYRLILEEGGFL